MVVTDFLARLIGRSSWSLPLAEPVIDPLYSPRHEALPTLEINRSGTEGVVQSSSIADSMTDGMGFRAKGTSSLMDNGWAQEGKRDQIALSGSGANPIGDTRCLFPVIPQTGERDQSPPQTFAPLASENNSPKKGEEISKEPGDGTPPERFDGKPSEPGRAHISSRMKGPENSPDQKRSQKAQAYREEKESRSPAYSIDLSQSQRGPVERGSVPITFAASRNPMTENWHDPTLKIAREAEDRSGSEVLTAQPVDRSASRSRSRISGWERPGPRIGDETKRAGPPVKIIEEPQSIRVTIGRIDVRAVTRQQPANPKPTPPAPDRVPSLEEYMRKRNGVIR